MYDSIYLRSADVFLIHYQMVHDFTELVGR